MENRQVLNRQLAQMLKGGVIMDVTTPEQAKIAEAAGACAVMALERIPADIRAAGGVSRMSDPKMIKGIQSAVSIPVMAKCRIGHFVEAQILEAIEIDYIDESEVLSPADDVYHIDKRQFKVPFVCGARDLGEALRRIGEGATMIRTKGEPGTGDVVQAVRHMRRMQSEIRRVANMADDELYEAAKQLGVPYDLLRSVHDSGKLPTWEDVDQAAQAGNDAKRIGTERNTALSQNRANTVISWLNQDPSLKDASSQIYLVGNMNGGIRTVTDKSTRGLNAKLGRCVKVRIQYMMQ
jgi:pyridoxal 5'-phosphate synthase pdxS subunit